MATVPGYYSKLSLEVKEADITAEKPAMALAYWRAKLKGRYAPDPSDFDPAELGKVMAWMQWLEVADEGHDFRYLVVGEIPLELHRAPTQGRKISEITEWSPAWKDSISGFYEFVYEARRPVWTAGNLSAFDKDWKRFESVNLPWSADGTRVDHILTVTEYFDGEPDERSWGDNPLRRGILTTS